MTLEARFRAAVALHRQGRLGDAEAMYRELAASQPDLTIVRHNLIALLRAEGRWDDAEEVLRAALAVNPGDAELQFGLGISRLAAGAYAEGWPLFEARRRIRVGQIHAPSLSFPEWKGQPVASLLLWGEQGFGDQIQFARYIPRLKEICGRLTVVCKPGLSRLFAPLGIEVVPAQGQVSIGRHDAWVLMGSLPLLCGTRLETIPPAVYLPGTEGGSGTGVVVRGRPAHPNDANRSLPPPAARRLLDLPGAVSLDPSDTGARDFQDTADIVRGLARVVTVDTSVAHLAGAMGKPAWILLPAVGTDWRWLRDRRDSPWYPSATLFRQDRPGDWTGPIGEVAARLAG